MMTEYMKLRAKMKQGKEQTAQQVTAEKKKAPATKKSSKKKGAKTTNAEKAKAIARKKFFDEMIDRAPEACQETGQPLSRSFAINPRSIVAHILPKRDKDKGGVPSMQYDTRNVVYLDQDVHTNMDRKGADFVKAMKIFPLMLKRVAEMWPNIPEDERRNVPEYLRPL